MLWDAVLASIVFTILAAFSVSALMDALLTHDRRNAFIGAFVVVLFASVAGYTHALTFALLTGRV